jgi:hypothetical protein
VIVGDATPGGAYRRTGRQPMRSRRPRIKPRKQATSTCQLPTTPRSVESTGGFINLPTATSSELGLPRKRRYYPPKHRCPSGDRGGVCRTSTGTRSTQASLPCRRKVTASSLVSPLSPTSLSAPLLPPPPLVLPSRLRTLSHCQAGR